MDADLETALGTVELAEGVTAEAHFNGLDDAGKAPFQKRADEIRLTRDVSKAVLDTITPVIGSSVDKSLESKLPDLIAASATKIVHQRLDAAGIKPNDGAGPNVNKTTDGKPDPNKPQGVPEHETKMKEQQKQIDDLTSRYNQGQVSNKVMEIVSSQGVEFVNDKARKTAIAKLTAAAKLADDGGVTFDMDVDLTGGGSELRVQNPADAMNTLRGQETYLFKANPSDGTGGGGGAGSGPGAPDALPANIGYREVMSSPKMLRRFMDEAPERLEAIKAAFDASPEGKRYRNIISGKGENASDKVDRNLNKR